jgi:FdhD protein
MCGRVSADSLERDVAVATAAWTVPATIVSALPSTLRESQRAFAETGGLHAAGLFDRDGRLERSAEDVGRHNALDKLIGRAWLDGDLPLSDALLCVSGRLSFELVQKALLAGAPLLAAVSAPSSMAVDLATHGGMTLVGFVRGERFNIYAHPERVERCPRT